MKKKINIALIIILIACVPNINTYGSSQIDSIRSAIKKSRPQLLKDALNYIKLTEQDKNALLSMALSISRARENKMNIQLIRPKEKPNPDGGGLYFVIGSIMFSTAITDIFILTGFFSKVLNLWHSDSDIPYAIVLTAISYWACRKLGPIARQKDKEFLEKYRSPKQKYKDSLEVIAILKLN